MDDKDQERDGPPLDETSDAEISARVTTSSSSRNPNRDRAVDNYASYPPGKPGGARAVDAAVTYDNSGHAVIWSAEDHEYVGLAKSYPSMSWLASTHGDALTGIRLIAAIADLERGIYVETGAVMDGEEIVGFTVIRRHGDQG